MAHSPFLTNLRLKANLKGAKCQKKILKGSFHIFNFLVRHDVHPLHQLLRSADNGNAPMTESHSPTKVGAHKFRHQLWTKVRSMEFCSCVINNCVINYGLKSVA